MKKLVSLLLCAIMLFSLSAPAAAIIKQNKIADFSRAILSDMLTTQKSFLKINRLSISLLKKLQPIVNNMVLNSDNWKKASDFLMKKLVESFDKISGKHKSDKPVNPDKPTDSQQLFIPQKQNIADIVDVLRVFTFCDFIKFVQKYFIVRLDDIDKKSKDIADYAEYKYVVNENDKKTVYILVNIENNPQLLNKNLLRETVERLYKKQNEKFDDKADILMSYEHIAGELAMHALMYAVSNEYLTITGKTEGLMYDYWQKARTACLNEDENRLPSEIFDIIGTYITGVFIINLYKLYKIFSHF